MSNWLITQVYARKVGNLGQSAVMAQLADRASDDGTGIWPSKQKMAEGLGMTKRGIIKVIDGLIERGLVVEVGQRPCENGITIEYAIAVDQLMRLPIHQKWMKELERIGISEPRSPLPVNDVHPSAQQSSTDPCTTFTRPVNEVHPTDEPRSPKPSLTPKEPSTEVPKPKAAARKASAKVTMTADWQPAPLPDDLAKLIDLWPAERRQRELRDFREYWIERGERRPGWDRTWRQWVGRVHDRVMRDCRGSWQQTSATAHSDVAAATDAFTLRMERHKEHNPGMFGGR